jgi:hypothetical protein
MLVIWYVDAGNTSHSTLSNDLSLLHAEPCPDPGACRYHTPGRSQTAPQSSDIANKNQPVLVGLIPDAACVADQYYRSHGQHPCDGPPYSSCKFSLLMHVPSLQLLPTWVDRALLSNTPRSTIILQISLFHH